MFFTEADTLKADLEAANDKIAKLDADMKRLSNSYASTLDKYDGLCACVNYLINNKVITDAEELAELSQYMFIDAEREVEVTIEASITTVVTLPYGFDKTDLQFDLDLSEYNGYDLHNTDVEINIQSVEEL